METDTKSIGVRVDTHEPLNVSPACPPPSRSRAQASLLQVGPGARLNPEPQTRTDAARDPEARVQRGARVGLLAARVRVREVHPPSLAYTHKHTQTCAGGSPYTLHPTP
jgi:hypothetical protein